MSAFHATGDETIGAVAQHHNFSRDAVVSMLGAIRAGHGRMAQFDHPEFGGSGQWMRGGMTMISTMFDAGLKARINALCDDLALVAEREPQPANVGGDGATVWWPPDLGVPTSTGSQNGSRYAYFAAVRRLATDTDGRVVVYDTRDHRISGVAQAQGRTGSLTFSDQDGHVVELTALSVAAGAAPQAGSAAPSATAPDAIDALERLAALHAKGVLSDVEFSAKKAELLRRI